MNDRINKTSICSIVFLDIIDYSTLSDAEQIAVKNQFNDLINLSLKSVAINDRIILDTGDGAAIAHMGSPEDAMFVALTIRDGILKSNTNFATPLFVRFGINLGPVRIVTDINGQPNIIGDGINVAQRIMSFAQPNQILVSRSYYEVTSRLTQEFSEMFAYSGVKHDKHVREHEVYSVRSHIDHDDNASQPAPAKDERRFIPSLPRVVFANKLNWKYALLALPAVIALGLMVKMSMKPVEPNIVIDTISTHATVADVKLALPDTVAIANATNTAKPQFINSNNNGLMPNETIETQALVEKMPETVTTKTAHAATSNTVTSNAENQVQTATEQAANDAKLAKKLAKIKAKQKAESALAATPVQTPVQAVKNIDSAPKVMQVSKIDTQPTRTFEVKAEKTKQKSGWKTFTDSVKQGQERHCSQSEIAMNQCQ